jgi:hypothetical protein
MDYWLPRRTVLCQNSGGHILYVTVTGHHLIKIYLEFYSKGIDSENHFAESPQYSDFINYFSDFSIIKKRVHISNIHDTF